MLLARRLTLALALFATSASVAFAQPTLQFFVRGSADVPRRPKQIAVGDFDSDGVQDVAVASSGSNRVSILLTRPGGEVIQGTSVTIGKTLRDVATGDFDQDGDVDVAVASGSKNSFILLGNANGTLGTPRTVRRCCGGFFVERIDIDGQRGDDLVFTNPTQDDVSLLVNRGQNTASFEVEKRFKVGNRPEEMEVADINRDGLPDVVVLNTIGGGSEVTTLLSDANGVLRPVANFITGRNSKLLALGDIDGDDLIDVITGAPRRNEFSVLFNTGSGFLSSPQTTIVPCFPGSIDVETCAMRDIVAADFDQDSMVDIAVGLSFPESTDIEIETGATKIDVLRGLGNGFFATPLRIQDFAKGIPILEVGHFNEDGFPDIAVATRLDSRLRIILNATFGLPSGVPTTPPTVGPGTPTRTPTPTPSQFPTQEEGQPGDPCDLQRGDEDCNFPLFCSGTGTGTEGVCCNTPCDGANEACDLEGSEGTCQPTGGDVGDPCQVDGQCNSTFCTDGFCCNVRCLEEGMICNRAGEEGICGVGMRATPTAIVGRPNGDPCDSASQCQSGFCPVEDGVCCDTACTGADQSCASGTCVTSGLKPNGEPCAAGNECLSGFCPPDDGVCCNEACLAANESCGIAGAVGTCLDTTTKKDNGEPCDSAVECLSGFCPVDDDVCCNRACLGANESCSIAGAEGTCLKENGEPCSSALECRSGFCPTDDDVCCESPCTAANESCSLPGLEGACLEEGDLGDPCSGPEDCLSGFCPLDDLVCCERACTGANESCDALGRCTVFGEVTPTATRTPTRTPTPVVPGLEIDTVRGSGCDTGGDEGGPGLLLLATLPLWLWANNRRTVHLSDRPLRLRRRRRSR